MSTWSLQRDMQADVWSPLSWFIGLIAVESTLWRAGGWLGCRNVIACCVDIRLA